MKTMTVLRYETLLVSGFALALAFGTAGCVTRLADMGALSTQPHVHPGDRFRVSKKAVEGRVDTAIYVLIPYNIGDFKLENAIRDALIQGEGDLLTDVVVYHEAWYIPLIYGEASLIVKGDVWRREDTKAEP